jgi:hypothetical protein
MYAPLLGLCLGIALVVAFPNRSPLALLGFLVFLTSALALVVLFIRSIVRSIRSREWHGDQLLVGVIVALLVSFFVQRLDSPGESAEIERVVGTVATSTNPAYCDELTTQRYLRQVTGNAFPFADEVCESEASEGAADSVEVREVAVDDNSASAVVANHGGSFDGSVVVTHLVQRDGDWRVDRLASFERFDRERLESLGFSRQKAACVLRRERRLSDAEVEAALLDPSYGVFAELVLACDRRGVERRLRWALADPSLRLPRDGVDCVERRLETATDAELAEIQFDLLAYNLMIVECDRGAVLAYQRRELEAGDLDPAVADCVFATLTGLAPAEAIRLTYDEARYRATIERCRLHV